jgi:hypothetical protein
MAVWYSVWSFGNFFPFWYVWTKKNLAAPGSNRRNHLLHLPSPQFEPFSSSFGQTSKTVLKNLPKTVSRTGLPDFPSKIDPNCDFWIENKLSGTPAVECDFAMDHVKRAIDF